MQVPLLECSGQWKSERQSQRSAASTEGTKRVSVVATAAHHDGVDVVEWVEYAVD
jgi:uncharacterized membrane protein